MQKLTGRLTFSASESFSIGLASTKERIKSNCCLSVG